MADAGRCSASLTAGFNIRFKELGIRIATPVQTVFNQDMPLPEAKAARSDRATSASPPESTLRDIAAAIGAGEYIVSDLEQFSVPLHRDGFVHMPGRPPKCAPGTGSAWAERLGKDFAESWNDLGTDTYMADGGRYRRRRYAAFSAGAGGLRRKAAPAALPKPRLQRAERRNCALVRADQAGDCAHIQPWLPVLQACLEIFTACTRPDARPENWHVEVHQFRIETRAGEAGPADTGRAASRRRGLGAGAARAPPERGQRRNQHSRPGAQASSG